MPLLIKTLLSFLLLSITTFSFCQVKKPHRPPVAMKEKPAQKEYTIVGYDTTYSYWTLIDSAGFDSRGFVMDADNNIYCIKTYGIGYQYFFRQKVYQLVNEKLVDVNPSPDEWADWLFVDYNSNVILRTSLKDEKAGWRYYRRNNQHWDLITNTDSIKMLVDQAVEVYKKKKSAVPEPPAALKEISWLPYPLNQYIIIASEDHVCGYYEYTGNAWKKIGSLPGTIYGYNSFLQEYLAGKKYMYRINPGSGNGLFRYDGNRTYTIKEKRYYMVEKVPFAGKDADKAEAMDYIFKSIGIYEKNGKLGLKSSVDGTIVTYPLFSSITFEKSPHADIESENTKFLYHLVGGGMNIYCYKYNVDSNILTGYTESKTLCPKCHGLGRVMDTTYEKDKEWVSTSTSGSTSSNYERVWNSGCNCYVGVKSKTTTGGSTGGYYKDKGRKKVVVDRGLCEACDGGKSAVTVKVHKYYYDEKTNSYKDRITEYQTRKK